MNIYVYSDESGVFDKKHNDIYVFGGIIILGEEGRENWIRLYSHAESVVRENGEYDASQELKASLLSRKEKYSLYRSLNRCFKFGAVIKEQDILANIFENKKHKQRYLDYAYKVAVKDGLKSLIKSGRLDIEAVENINFFVDEHTTATSGRYELREALEQELKFGTYNWSYVKFFPPLFPNMSGVQLQYCNSAKKPLIRAADIVANHFYHIAVTDGAYGITNNRDTHVKVFP